MKSKAFILVISLLATAILIGCGSSRNAEKKRTSEVSEIEFSDHSLIAQSEQSQEESENNVKKSEQIVVNNKDQTQTVKETIEPIDPRKKATYRDKNGNLQELNNAKKTTETTTRQNNSRSDTTVKTETQQKNKLAQSKKGSQKNALKVKAKAKKAKQDIAIHRKGPGLWNLLWLLLLAVVIWIIKKYKNKIVALWK